MPALSPWGPAAVCFMEWKSGLFPLPGFLLAAVLPCSPLFPLGPRQLLGVCVCNLLFCCRWLVPSLWLLSLRLRRDEELDLLCADGDFIWLEPPFEMFQGATEEQKKEWLGQISLINCFVIGSVTQVLPPCPPLISSHLRFSLLTPGEPCY